MTARKISYAIPKKRRKEKILKAAIAEFKGKRIRKRFDKKHSGKRAYISRQHLSLFYKQGGALLRRGRNSYGGNSQENRFEFEHGSVEAKDVSDATVDFIWENKGQAGNHKSGQRLFRELQKNASRYGKAQFKQTDNKPLSTLLTKIKIPTFFLP